VLALAPLPFDITWVDPRRHEFPSAFPQGATPIAPPDVPALVRDAPAGAFLLVMTHSHALDLAIVAAALRRPDLELVGLIGSATKRARFVSQLRQAGQSETAIARLVCPIGVRGLRSKEPAVIAAGVTVQLLQQLEVAAQAQTALSADFNTVRSNFS
jgi:xanthine dehydrogenase accessory factor